MSDYDKLSKNTNANEYDMLRGNINRMLVTDDYEEFRKMYECALYRLEKIKSYNAHRIKNQEKK